MQKSQNILHYQGIGDVHYVRNTRARNLAIRINQQGEVRVTIPRHVSFRRAESFFLSKQEWVQKRLNGLPNKDCRNRIPSEGSTIQIRGKSHQIQLLPGDENVEAAIWRLLGKEALAYLPDRVAELSELHDFHITGLKIRKMKSRWGSCTARKSINLNSWLIMLPEHLSDYVILHELMHIRIHDHSKRFWEELDALTEGRSKKLRKELGSYQIMCFPDIARNQ
jgi:hypothetical protein